MKIGSGDYKYELVEGWAQIPVNKTFGWGAGLVVDSQDNVYAHSSSLGCGPDYPLPVGDAVLVFSREGEFLTSWGKEFSDGAHGLYHTKEGSDEYLFVIDEVRCNISKTTLDGTVLWTIGAPDLPDIYSKETPFVPTDVAVAPNGEFYVADGYGQDWIHHYDHDGKRIRSWAGPGSEPGKVKGPHGIWVDTRRSEPLIYIADRTNERIQVFTLDGEHVRFVDGVRRPCCFYQYEDNLYIPDLRSRVTVLGINDEVVVHLGDDAAGWTKPDWPRNPASEYDPAKFVAPHALTVDSRGDLYVIEWVPTARLRKFARIR